MKVKLYIPGTLNTEKELAFWQKSFEIKQSTNLKENITYLRRFTQIVLKFKVQVLQILRVLNVSTIKVLIL